jgi:hypothetical protein
MPKIFASRALAHAALRREVEHEAVLSAAGLDRPAPESIGTSKTPPTSTSPPGAIAMSATVSRGGRGSIPCAAVNQCQQLWPRAARPDIMRAAGPTP